LNTFWTPSAPRKAILVSPAGLQSKISPLHINVAIVPGIRFQSHPMEASARSSSFACH
jgi:hypothetical protein